MSNPGITIKTCPEHGEYNADANDSPCPTCVEEGPFSEKEDTELSCDKHSVNCYFCNDLVDERNCMPADEFNDNDGGDICPKCLKAKQDGKPI